MITFFAVRRGFKSTSGAKSFAPVKLSVGLMAFTVEFLQPNFRKVANQGFKRASGVLAIKLCLRSATRRLVPRIWTIHLHYASDNVRSAPRRNPVAKVRRKVDALKASRERVLANDRLRADWLAYRTRRRRPQLARSPRPAGILNGRYAAGSISAATPKQRSQWPRQHFEPDVAAERELTAREYSSAARRPAADQ